MLLQCTALSVSPPPTARFSIAWRAGLSGIVALFLICVRSYEDLLAGNLDASLIALVGVEAFAGLVISLLCFTIPRRPDVFYNGIVIDQEFTTSLLGWISFSWTELVLRKSDRSQCLTVDDLPELNHATRGENVYRSWEEKLPRHKALSVWDLWLSVLRSHRVALAWQVIITVLLSVLSFVPQLTLLRILTLLQARQSGESSGPLWVPVVGLGLAVLTSATLETLKYWFSYNKLAIRVQQQLSLAIFHKAVRLSRVSGSTESDEAGSSQSPVNMVAVDVKNIADFLCFFFLTYESPLKIGLASVFLIYLLGWQSLLAGLVVLGLLTLFSTLAGWKYSHCQGSLMQFRDDRLRFLTEMLQGVRQIKFSAQESRWEKKTNQLRDVEMRAQWTVCSWQIAFISLYSISPILLSATCLSVYVLLSGSLSAATAFTSISVLSSIEVSMTILPDVISFLLNARVSMRRINSYLGQPEHVNPNIPSSEIKFKDAVIAWPGCRDGPGTLREMNLQFPREGLSIVTGPTGSGKSLLLASILGETDVLEGTVSAPTAAPFEEVAFPPTSQYWLMDSALAFVSQSPWLVNTTLKDNILLGLPLDPKRYAKVVFACALQEDLARLPDMDQTQVTSKGANLSGGQKWRICLARALYSRARTLVMDDIFSALDVHTREHIHQHVLGGELLRGRTCILATHHLELCMPRAKYLVRLEQGALKSATVLSPSVPGPEVDGSSNEEQEYFEPSWRNTADLISGENQIPPAPGNLEQEKENELAQNSPSIISTIVSVFLEGGSPFQWLLLGIAFFAYGGSMLGRVSLR